MYLSISRMKNQHGHRVVCVLDVDAGIILERKRTVVIYSSVFGYKLIEIRVKLSPLLVKA